MMKVHNRAADAINRVPTDVDLTSMNTNKENMTEDVMKVLYTLSRETFLKLFMQIDELS